MAETPTLAEIRARHGAEGARAAIVRALEIYPSVTEAAASLGTDPSNLRRAARRAGVALPKRPGAPGSAGGKYAKTAENKQHQENRHDPLETRSDRT